MKENTIAKAIVLASVVIGLSTVLGCYIISRTPHFERVSDLGQVNVLIETRTGSYYEQKEGSSAYGYVPGPKASGSRVDPVYGR